MGLAKQYGFKLVTTQIDQVGATDVTPQVLAMLAAKPQIILFGLVPGTDSISAIRAIRAQNPTIPISDCSACGRHRQKPPPQYFAGMKAAG